MAVFGRSLPSGSTWTLTTSASGILSLYMKPATSSIESDVIVTIVRAARTARTALTAN
jgi:hypothetical protein